MSLPPRCRTRIASLGAPALPPADRAGKLRLDMNENQWGPSPRVVERIAELLTSPQDLLSSYGFVERVREAIAERLALRPSEIVLTAGGDEGISLLFEAFVEPEDVVVLPSPSFVTFRTEAKAAGATIRNAPYGPDLDFPREDYLAALEPSPRVAVLVNPNNPTGDAVELDYLLAVCRRVPDALVIADEAYFEYHGETALSLPVRPPNLVVLRTFSKAYGLAGLRVAYLVGHPEVVSALEKLRTPFSIATPSLAAAIAALEDEDHLRSHLSALAVEMQWLADSLTARGLPSRTTRANFVLVQAGARSDRFSRALASAGILVSDRSAERGMEGIFRITVGRREQNEAVVAALDAGV